MARKQQLELAPSSRNQRKRQSAKEKAVVSVRMLGVNIDRLDAEAERITREESRHPWNKANRTTVIERALADYFAKRKKG